MSQSPLAAGRNSGWLSGLQLEVELLQSELHTAVTDMSGTQLLELLLSELRPRPDQVTLQGPGQAAG